jgi:peptide/nickel transport system substrate-binding protein
MRLPTRPVRLAAGAAAATLVAGLALTGTAAADSSSPSPSAAATTVVFTVGNTQDIDSANPFTGVTSAAYEIYQDEYPILTRYSAKDFSVVPGLAESWQESADHLTWTYKIRAGLKWSDGVPLTAKDAAYTFNRIIDPKNSYEKTNFSSYTANITKAAAPDDTTLVLTVNKPSPIMEKLYVYILPEHVWSKIDEKAVTSYKNEGTPAAPTVGAGPFVMVERQVGQFVRLKANPYYYGGKPKIDELVYKIYKNGDAMGQALKKGEIDFAEGLEANVYKSLQGQPGITAVTSAALYFNEMAFNTGAALDDGTPIGNGNAVLKDKKFRVALQYAVDRQALVAKVLGGDGIPGDTVIPPAFAQFHLDPANPYTYDVAKAKSLLDAAGYKVGADGIRTDSAGKKISLRLFGRSSSDTSKKAVEFLKGYLAAVGLDAVVSVVSEDALTEKIGQGDYDLFEWGWGVEPDPNYQLSTFTCASRSYKQDGAILANLSDSFYCNPAYDKLNDQQQSETDSTKRADLVKQMQQMLYDDAPYLVTYYSFGHEAYRSDKFTGFVPQPEKNGSLLFQYGTWSLDNVAPVVVAGPGENTGTTSSSGTNWAVIGGIAALVLLALGVGLWLGRGRDRDLSTDDVE